MKQSLPIFFLSELEVFLVLCCITYTFLPIWCVEIPKPVTFDHYEHAEDLFSYVKRFKNNFFSNSLFSLCADKQTAIK